MDEQLPILYRTVGVLQIQRSGPDGLDLRARKLDARLVAVLHEVVVEGLAVLGRDLDSLLLRGAHLFPGRFYYNTIFSPHLQEKVTVGFFWRICYNKVIEYVLNIQKIDTRWNAI